MTRHRSLLVVLSLSSCLLAQAERRQTVTTPRGIFVQEPSGAGAGPAANPNPSPAAVRWTYASSSLPWITQSVGCGNHGTLAWLGQNLNGQRLSLLQTQDDTSPAVARWETLTPGVGSVQVKAARKARAAALTLVTNSPSYLAELRYYRSDSSTFVWSTPITGPTTGSGLTHGISDDGRYVVVGYTNASLVAEAQVFDASSAAPGTPLRTITTSYGRLRRIDVAANGLWVLFGTDTANLVYNTLTGTLVTSDFTTVSHDAHAIDATGTTWGRGGFDVGAWKLTTSGWVRVLNFTDQTLGFGIYTACDLSPDGSTFAVAATDANNNYLPFRVYCWRLSTTGATLLWTYGVTGSGSYQDTPQACSVSDDGKYVAVGSWGTQSNSHPEALLFDRDAGNVPIGSIDTPGSVFDVDLASDGQFMVVGTKSVHANTFGNGGAGYSFDRGGQGHRLKGPCAPGAGLRLETGGNVGEPVVEILGTALLAVPFPIPGIVGPLRIDLSQPYATFLAGTVPPGGVQVLTLTAPASPSLIGASLFSQAGRLASPPELENALLLTFTP